MILAHTIDTQSGNASGGSLYQALAPSVAQFGGLGKILMLSSPWTQSGIFWDLFKQAKSGNFHHMQAVQCPTWEVNPTINEEFLEQERIRDPELFAVEYGANFSQLLSAFIDFDLIENAVNYERSVLPPQSKYKGRYYLSLDPAKGNRDQYTACIVHYEGQRLIIDKWHEFKASLGEGKKKQVNIAEVENWILEQHQLYGFSEVVLDQYNSAATIQKLSGRLNVSEIFWTVWNKMEAYSKIRELFNSGNIDLYLHPKANQQLKNLTVVYRSSGQWSVSGGSGSAVDDYASALAGCVLKAQQSKQIHSVANYQSTDRYGRAINQASSSGRASARQIREFF